MLYLHLMQMLPPLLAFSADCLFSFLLSHPTVINTIFLELASFLLMTSKKGKAESLRKYNYFSKRKKHYPECIKEM